MLASPPLSPSVFFSPPHTRYMLTWGHSCSAILMHVLMVHTTSVCEPNKLNGGESKRGPSSRSFRTRWRIVREKGRWAGLTLKQRKREKINETGFQYGFTPPPTSRKTHWLHFLSRRTDELFPFPLHLPSRLSSSPAPAPSSSSRVEWLIPHEALYHRYTDCSPNVHGFLIDESSIKLLCVCLWKNIIRALTHTQSIRFITSSICKYFRLRT